MTWQNVQSPTEKENNYTFFMQLLVERPSGRKADLSKLGFSMQPGWYQREQWWTIWTDISTGIHLSWNCLFREDNNVPKYLTIAVNADAVAIEIKNHKRRNAFTAQGNSPSCCLSSAGPWGENRPHPASTCPGRWHRAVSRGRHKGQPPYSKF